MEESFSLRKLFIYYYRYKDTPYYGMGVLGAIAIASILLLFFVVLPQFGQFFSLQREIDTVEDSIAVMRSNEQYIASLSQTEQTQQSDTVLAALPIVKDYAGAYTAILSAASANGVGLSNFQYEVGTLDSSGLEGNGIAQMRVTLSITGSPQSINAFMISLSESLPLATTNLVTGSSSLSNLEVAFYYGGEQLIQVDPGQPIPTLTQDKQNLLEMLSQYRPQIDTVFVPSQATESAGFSELPF